MNNLIEEAEKKRGVTNWVYVLIFTAAMAPQVYKLSFPVSEMCALSFQDDIFYYYKTAINIRNGFGSTFDKVNTTNGYHPLWMIICVGLAFITTDIYAYFYIALIANLLLVFLVSLLLLRMFRESLGIWFSAVLIFLLNWHKKSSCAIFSGMETPLYLLLVLLCIEMMVMMSWHRKKELFALGILVGLTFLARTSFILSAPVLSGYVVYRFFKDRSMNFFTTVICILIPASLITIPYLIWNFTIMGHFEQVSGLVKNLWNCGAFETARHFTSTLNNFAQKAPFILQPKGLTIIPVVLLCLCVSAVIKKWHLCVFLKDHRIILLLVFALFSAGYYFISFGRATRLWHLAPTLMVLNVVFIHALKVLWDSVGRQRTARIAVLVMTVVMLVNCLFHVVIYRYSFPSIRGRDAMAAWIRDNLPKDSKIGIWSAGYIGYFSEHDIINLDGLINGKELYNYYKDGRGVWKYIIDKRLDYISNGYLHEPPGPTKSILNTRLKEIYHRREFLTGVQKHAKVIDWYVWQIQYED